MNRKLNILRKIEPTKAIEPYPRDEDKVILCTYDEPCVSSTVEDMFRNLDAEMDEELLALKTSLSPISN